MTDFFFWALLWCCLGNVFLVWKVAGLHIRMREVEAMASALLAISNAQQSILDSTREQP